MAKQKTNSDNLLETSVDLDIVIGRATVPLKILLNCSEGSLFELEDQDYGRLSGERANGSTFRLCIADTQANGKTFAKEEIMSVGNNFGARVVEIVE